ncbi:DUF3717 domain-containing protein [Burkholderia multivorans]|uniref:DUF3717 domain-containing protein n=1 Tax=Burkholderia multivorans TaxID=87883 RepID=UPI001588B05C|nr:DUF3717 domain-containing protein [Burkholderia multivorans]MDR8878074.1 hypothetical protein [Burkholderia multivorans]MDR8882428.1 hypothetical protein [Burkholderia multivorans]MDR8889512.1 hypothetical protein [Burkholderia multivorans]MDR8908265.1 hypothetical protein [Burkholderia multivorans]MDR8915069.1 hypothetical protein [Burkholderia multivorans]
MTSSYTIGEMEMAINFWRERDQSGTDAALCAGARALAEPYTLMFLAKRTSIDEAELAPDQLAALQDALKSQSAGVK